MDDNRVIIDNVNFNRNLPKWATDDTLSRIEKMVGRSHKESQKSLTDVVRTLKTISNKDADLFKETQNSNKAIKKELTKLTKILSQNNRNTTTTKPTTNNEQVAIAKKTNVTLEKGFKSLDNSLDDVIDSILSGNSETSRHLQSATNANEKVSEQLLKIYDELRNISSGGGNSTPTTGNDTSTSDSNDRQGEQTNVLLGDIKQILSKQNTLQTEMYRKSMSDEDFQRIMENNAKRSGEEYRDASEQTMGSLSSMLSTAINRVDSGADKSLGTRALTGTLTTLASTIGTLAAVIKATPLGRMASIAMGAYATANKMFEYAYDVQTDFRGMIDRGFNFSQLSQEVGPDRLDGISMRRSILRNDIGLETATQILEKNTRLLNEVGFSSMFGELGNIIGDIDDPNSVTNRLGMTRDQVALIATDFYAMHRRINNITKEFTAIERQNLASQFVENVRRMSQQLGVGLPQIREAIESFTSTTEFSRSAAFLDETQSSNYANLNAILSNSGLDNALQEAISIAATSIAGISDPRVMDIISKDPLTMRAFDAFSHEFSNTTNMGVEEQINVLERFGSFAERLLDEQGGYIVQSLSVMPEINQSLGVLSTVRGMVQQLSQTPADILMGGREEVSPLAAAARELENMGILIDARAEEMFASAADSSIGREVLANMLSADEIMKRAQLSLMDLTKDVVSGLFDGPIPTILRTIQRFVEKVADAVGWIAGKRHTNELTGATADNIIQSIQDHVLGKDAFDTIFSRDEVGGRTVYNIQEGITSDDLNSFLTRIYQDSDSREDREAIAGIVRNLSRGIDGNTSALSDDARQMMGSIEESFLGMASGMTSGNERDMLLDSFTGFENSANLLGERLLDNAFDNSNQRRFFNFRLTGNNIDRLVNAVDALDNIEIIDSDLVGSLEALQGRMEFNKGQEQLQRLREQQQSGQSIDHDVLNTIMDIQPIIELPDETNQNLILPEIIESNISKNSIDLLSQSLERNSNNLDIEWMRELTSSINQPTIEPIVLDDPEISQNSIDSLTQSLERNSNNLDVEWMRELTSSINQPTIEPITLDDPDISKNSIDALTQSLERNSNNLDIEWMRELTSSINPPTLEPITLDDPDISKNSIDSLTQSLERNGNNLDVEWMRELTSSINQPTIDPIALDEPNNSKSSIDALTQSLERNGNNLDVEWMRELTSSINQPILDPIVLDNPDISKNSIDALTQSLERNSNNLDIEWMRELTSSINQPILDPIVLDSPEISQNSIDALTRSLERNGNNLDIEWMRELTSTINQSILDPYDLDEPVISQNSIDALTQSLERNSTKLDVEWVDRLMTAVNTTSQPEEPIISDYQDTPLQNRSSTALASATINEFSPVRLQENIDQQGIINELRKQEEQRQYTEQVRQAGENSFNQFTQNTEQNETINNNQDNTDISEALAQMATTQQRLAEGIDRNSRALERYIATKT